MTNYLKLFRGIALAGSAACMAFALLPSLQADAWDKKTTLTITEPIQVPSCCTPGHTVTLEPGEYMIVLVDSLSDRHIVRIFDKDQHVITTILAVPNYRLQPTGHTAFQFWEVPAGEPRAIRAWFYPGDNFGQEFVYPKQTAAQIAAAVKTTVPAIEVETSAVEDLKTVPLVAVDESGKTTELTPTLPERASDSAMRPALQDVTVDAAPVQTVPVQTVPVQTAPVQTVAVPQTADRLVETDTPAPVETMPETASALPLLGLAGLISLGLYAALGFRSRRRRLCKV
jgi:hypothetical protein